MKKKTLFALLLGSTLAFGQDSRNENRFSSPYSNNYQRMSGGYDHSLEIRAGKLYAYGGNGSGQLGQAGGNQSSPVHVDTHNATWVNVSAGNSFSAGIRADGTLWTWGLNSSGQLGDGTTTSRSTITKVGTDVDWVSVSAGDAHMLAIKSDGTLWAWGNNGTGRLGDGTTTNRTAPTQIGSGTTWRSISAGLAHTLAIKADGTLWAWGDNASGVLGDGTTTSSSSPVQVGSAVNWLKVSTGKSVLALNAKGEIWAWGNNTYGQLGDGTTTNSLSPVNIGAGYTAIASGDGTSLALKEGKLYGWGYNVTGALGDGTSTNHSSPTLVNANTNQVAIEAGYTHSLALRSTGILYNSGSNGSGQLGVGNTTNQATFFFVTPFTTPVSWLKVEAGDTHTTAIKTNGTLWAWGDNSSGQLGDGTTTNSSTPVQVGSATDWIAIASNGGSNLAIKADGTLWAWGFNYTSSPAQITVSGKRWRMVDIGISPQYLAVATDGTLWTWGSNTNGELGHGNTTSTTTPTQVGSAVNWVSAKGGFWFSGALQANGTVWTTGYNADGELGNGTTTNSTSLGQVGSSTDNISLTLAFFTSYVVKSNGTLYGWGRNDSAQLSNGNYTNQTSPVQVDAAGTDAWISIVAHNEANLKAIKSDGTLWAWVYNSSGQFGNGTYTGSSTPLQITSQTGVIQATSGYEFSGIIKANRTAICMTGANTYGQLGDGTTTGTNTFSCTSIIAIGVLPEVVVGEPVTIDNAVGIDETNDQTVVIYPNPTNGNITVQSSQAATYSLVDQQGKRLFSGNLEATGITSIDLSGISSGIYTLELISNDQRSFSKVIKQ